MQEADLDKALQTGEPFGIGAIVCDRDEKGVNEFLYATGAVTRTILEKWHLASKCTLKRCIMGVELVALLQMTLNPEMVKVLSGKRVIHFIDNIGAWAVLTRASSRKKDYDELSRMIHTKFKEIDCHVHYLYVPSAQNCSDIPSRLIDGSAHVKTLSELYKVLDGFKHRRVSNI